MWNPGYILNRRGKRYTLIEMYNLFEVVVQAFIVLNRNSYSFLEGISLWMRIFITTFIVTCICDIEAMLREFFLFISFWEIVNT